MDFGAFEIGGIAVLVLVLGIVEAAKRWGLQGRGSEILALCLGVFFVALAQAIQLALIPPAWVVWIEVIVIGLAGGLAATGIYDLVRKLAQR